MQYNIPYTIVRGLAFYERAEVEDLLSYLRFIANCRDKAAFDRIINTPARGIGKKGLFLIRESYKTDWIQSLMDARLPQKQRTNIEAFIKTTLKHSEAIEDRPFSVFMDLISELLYFD